MCGMYSSERHNLKANIQEYFRYSPKEVKNLVIAVVLMGFMVSFRHWGIGTEVSAGTGLLNWLNATLILALIMIIHTSAQKIMALSVGFNGEFRVWVTGLLVALVVCFLTRGYVWILAPGGLVVHHMATHRLGYYRYGLNQSQYSTASMSGPVATLLLAAVFRIASLALPPNALLQKAIMLCLWISILTALPIPPLSGAMLFYFSRLIYMLVFGTMLGMAVLLFFNVHFLFVILGSIAGGALLWFSFYWGFERKPG